MDAYEPNDTPAMAKRLSSRRQIKSGPFAYVGDDPRVTINATIHAGSDVDYYIVQGVTATLAERIFLGGTPLLQVYGNDSSIKLEVFLLNPDNSQGTQVANLTGPSCAPTALNVRLDPGVHYLVKVSGNRGRYTLSNGVGGDPVKIPILTHTGAYQVFHPGEPVEHVINTPEVFVFVADRAFKGIQTTGQAVHMRLLDLPGKLIAESKDGNDGERLNLLATVPGQVYALEITPKNSGVDERVLNLKWHAAKPERTSRNLIANPGAEMAVNGHDEGFSGWEPLDGLPAPQRIAYSSGDEAPSQADPGPKDRGHDLFASLDSNVPSGLRQTIEVDQKWSQAIGERRVMAHLSAFLGGEGEASALAGVRAMFLGTNGQQLGEVLLPVVGSREREGKTGLFPVEAIDAVPAGTVCILVDLTFGVGERSSHEKAYADNLELTLLQYER
jgi:hypothetical protein